VRVPKFKKHIVSEKGNERQGFVEEPQYRRMTDAAGPLWLKALMALAYNFGFRRGELLGNRKKGTEPMRWKRVDMLEKTVTLVSGETKNKEGRTVVLTEECHMLLGALRRGKQPEDFVFTWENGEPVKDFRGTWDKLTETAGVPGLLFHDFRRSSVRNMIRRGVPQKTARTVSGHKTDAVFERYNIVSEDDIRDAARRIEEGAKAAVANVIPTSFPLAPNQGNEEVATKGRKPS